MNEDRKRFFEMSDEFAGSNFREGLNVAWTKGNDSLVTIIKTLIFIEPV